MRILSVLAVVASAAQAQTPLVADTSVASAETLQWIAAHATPFASLESPDFSKWRSLVGSARLIGLGEQTHGTREFFEMKERLILDGIREMNVRVVAFEEAPATMAMINDVMHDSTGAILGTLDSLVRRMAPQWRTIEVRDFFRHARAMNMTRRASKLPQVDFIGVDSRGGPPAARDSVMAANSIAALAALPPSERVMLWSHNLHVGMLPNRIGTYLHRQLGAQYAVFGFATAEGTYRAHGLTDSARVWSEGHALKPSRPGSVESAFTPTPAAALLVDVRGIVADPRGAWLNTPRDFHHIGSNQDEATVQVYNIGETFDFLIFIPRTTTARALP